MPYLYPSRREARRTFGKTSVTMPLPSCHPRPSSGTAQFVSHLDPGSLALALQSPRVNGLRVPSPQDPDCAGARIKIRRTAGIDRAIAACWSLNVPIFGVVGQLDEQIHRNPIGSKLCQVHANRGRRGAHEEIMIVRHPPQHGVVSEKRHKLNTSVSWKVICAYL
jgi:hypothetical protein